MPAPLTPEKIAVRLNDGLMDAYRDIGSIMKGVALAAAAVVLIEILMGFSDTWPRLLPWGASVLATLVSYVTWGRGILLTNSRGNIWDIVLPLAIGVDEFCLFAILSPRPETINAWRWWFLVLALHGLVGALLTHNRSRNTLAEDFAPPLRTLGTELQGWIRNDSVGAATSAIGASLAGFLVVTILPACVTTIGDVLSYWGLVVPFIVALILVIRAAGQQRRRIDDVVHSTASIERTSDG